MMLKENYLKNITAVTGRKTRERDYWLNKLAGNPERSSFPYDFNPSPSAKTGRDSLKSRFSGEIFERLMKVTKGSDIRLFICLAAAIYALLNKYAYSGSRDIVIGAPIYKQEHEGEFINTVLILRNRVDDFMSFKDLLLQVSQTVMEAVENQNYPLEVLLKELNTAADGTDSPLFDTAVLLENIHDKRYIGHLTPNMIFSFLRTDGAVEAVVAYNPALYKESTVERVVRYLESLLRQVLLDVDRPLAAVDLLSAEDRKEILASLDNTGVDYPRHQTIQQLFAGESEKRPDKIALTLGPAQVSYRQLDKRANQLAAWLRGKHVKPASVVGLMMERSPEMITAILGILKAGGAYLPIDPDYPGKRVKYMLNDADVSLLLTESAAAAGHAFFDLEGGNCQPLLTAGRPQITDFDNIPIPDRSFVNQEQYNRFIGLTLVKNGISLQATRGCPYKCAYCHKIWPKNHVIRSAEHIFAEVKLYYDLGVRNFSFIDDIFNLNVRNSWRFFELVIENGLDAQFHFPAGLRGDILTTEYIDLLVRAGTVSIGLALETASPRLQRLIGKNLNLARFRENIEYLCKTYPHVIVELFFMHGFPGETEEEARLTLDFVKSLRWAHFPYFHILKIYPHTDMAKLALEHGISAEAIQSSVDLAYHELPETLPFDENFSRNLQAEFANEYFLSKERLLAVLPYQMKLLTEDELVQKYDSYLPQDIRSLDDFLEIAGIERAELGTDGFAPEEYSFVPGLNEKIKECFPPKEPHADALRVLLLDLSQFFSGEGHMLYDVVEPPLGLMYLMTYIHERFGRNINGRIAKSRLDFNSYPELRQILDAFKPAVIGIRTLSYYKNFFHRCLMIIRSWGYEGPVIAGGPYATSEYEAVLQDPNVDLVVLGEGEITFAEVIDRIMRHGGRLPAEGVLAAIPGLAYVPAGEGGERRRGRDIVLPDVLARDLAKIDGDGLEPVNRPQDPAYIIYTSGTTGLPKGALITHDNVVRLMKNEKNPFAFGAADVWTMFHSYCFDFSVWEMYGALLYGGRLVIIPAMTARSPEAFLHILKREGVTVLNQTPSAFYGLIDEESPCPDRLARLRYVIFGGEDLRPGKLSAWQSRYPAVGLINMYGITETTVHVTYKEITRQEIEHNTCSIGTPIPTLAAYVVDKHQRLLPAGIEGELLVSGQGVGRGYLNRGQQSREKFMDNPFKPGERLYRSGDLVKILADGELGYLGRIDQQVKIRGYRIEPGEIENRLVRHRQINGAVVIDRQQDHNKKYLCAYYTAAAELDTASLIDFLARELPEYMIPAYFVHLDKIPLTPNGKVDRSALPEPEVRSGREYAAPGNEVETALAEVWKGVLGMEKVGVNDNFFMLGGDSIKTIQIVSRLKSAGYKVDMRDIFERRTIRELAPLVTQLDKVTDQSVVSGPLPLTPIQRKFLRGDHTDIDGFVWPVVLVSRERLAGESVRAVFGKLQEHHDALRMTFGPDRDSRGQVIQRNAGLDHPLWLEEFDFCEEREAQDLLKQKIAAIQGGMDVQQGPLLRLGLFHLKDGDRLLIAVHHLVIDGVSWRILFEDIEALFQQYFRKERLTLPLKTDSFKAWAQHLVRYADSPGFLAERAYWAGLESAEVPEIDRDFAEQGLLKDRQGFSFSLGGKETELLLTETNGAFGTEINDILTAALCMAVRQVYGHDRVLLALEGHGRQDIVEGVDLSRTVGWFTVEYPVVLDAGYDDMARQIKEVKEALRRVPHKGIGYGILKYVTTEKNRQDIAFGLTPRISFNYLGQFDQDVKQMSRFSIARESAESEITLNRQDEYYLTVNGMVSHRRLRMVLYYGKKQFKPGTIKTLAQAYEAALKSMITFCVGRKKRELSPSDLTYKGLSIPQLDALSRQYEIEDIYTLSPMQEGMLFHALQAPSSSSYLEQISYRFLGELDPAAVEKSLKELGQRQNILRTAFVHEHYARPLQVILEDRQVDFCFQDIQSMDSSQKETFIKDYQARDKRNTFSLTHDALMRVALIRLAPREFAIIWTHHHILMDGWCIGIMINEFFEMYRALLESRPFRLPPVKPYSTYIKWLESQNRDEARDYWQEYLLDYDEAAAILNRGQAGLPAATEYRLARHFLVLGPEESTALSELAARNNTTLNVLMQAIWSLVLGRYSGKEDVVFGAVVSGRPTEIEGIESMVGLFINTIPVRLRFTADLRLTDLLQSVHRDSLASADYHYFPLVEIQSYSPLKQNLLDHIFVFENYPVARSIEETAGDGRGREVKGPGQPFRIADVEAFEQSNYDLNVIVIPGHPLSVEFRGNAAVYSQDVVERLKDSFKLIVEQIIDNENRRLGDLEITSERERGQILHHFNDTAAAYPTEKTIQQLLADQAAAAPEHIALEFEIHSLTYRELNRRACHLARFLRDKGVAAGTIVGLLTEHSMEAIVGITGILQAGGAYLTLDPAYPQRRLKYMLTDANVDILLTREKYPPKGDNFPPALPLDAVFDRCDGSAAPLEEKGSPQDLAYIIYTSGSTGLARGVLVEHRSVVRLVKHTNFIAFFGDDKLLQTGALEFDASTLEIWGPLLNGAALHLESKNNILSAENLKKIVAAKRITVMWMTSPLFNQMLDADMEIFSGLRVLLVGGDVLSPHHINRLRERFPALAVINGYGPTENVTFSTTHLIEASYRHAIPIGKPIANSTAYIVDSCRKLLPIGVAGELWVGGDGLARGYLNSGELTAEKFVQNRFPRAGRLYQTGDLARWSADGTIEFLGRRDHQVKIRGFRIELAEIENRLLEHADIAEAVVTVRQTGGHDRSLCAYYVSPDDPGAPSLRDFLRASLPDYMVPAHFVGLDRLPLTANGKIDRRILPDPLLPAAAGYVPPQDETEIRLAELFGEVLGIPAAAVSIDANFFELGGHSLKAVNLVARVHRELQVKVPLVEVFDSPTVRELARVIAGSQTDEYAALKPVEEKEYYPLSSAQQGMYILQHLDLDNTAYNIPRVQPLAGKIDRERLEWAFQRLIARHQSLRTAFILHQGRPVQRVKRAVDFAVECCEGGDMKRQIRQFVRPFDLAAAPLLRVGLIHTEEENVDVLLIDMHHIVSDAVSMGLMVEDLLLLFESAEPPALKFQYKDYAAFQDSQAQRAAIARQGQYWLKEFDPKPPPLRLPLDHERPPVQVFSGHTRNFELGREQSRGLKSTAAAAGATMYMVILATLNILLSKLGGQEDIVIGTDTAGRRHPDLERIVGMFVNTLALRNYPRAGRTFTAFLQEVKERTLAAFENQDYPFEELVAAAAARQAGHNPLFDVMFAMQVVDSPLPEAVDPAGSQYGYENRTAKFDMIFSCVEVAQRLLFVVEYNTRLFKAETVDRIIDYYREIVGTVLKNRDILLEDIAISDGLLTVKPLAPDREEGDFEF